MTLDGVELLPEEIIVRQLDKPGYAVASEGGYTAAVRTEVTPDLQREGMARELVHRIQNLRRDAGFDIADRITTWYQGAGIVHEAMERFADYVKAETLSLDLLGADPPSDARVERTKLDGQDVALGVRRVRPPATPCDP
ncbi:MAG: hypothetical protein FJ315_05255 [SAR202 cluster bacterium]|nr:hypothetical protein [SAR202 cluster bacterium]